MINIFIDTSAFYANLDTKDKNNKRAVSFFEEIKNSTLYQPVITNFVFNESITLVRFKLGIEASIEFGQSLLDSTTIKKMSVTDDIEKRAWKVFSKYKDKDFSFVDCTSFVVMKELNISKVFTFDKHFKQFGFEVVPG